MKKDNKEFFIIDNINVHPNNGNKNNVKKWYIFCYYCDKIMEFDLTVVDNIVLKVYDILE